MSDRGLQDLGDGCHAWLEPPGCWGFANSGLVVDGGQALLVDTQNDMRMAQDLRAAIDGLVGRPVVDQVVNTHGDGDHWNGNVLFSDATIIASEPTLADIRGHWLDPSKIDDYAIGDNAFAEFMRWRQCVFDYTGWRPVHPNQTYAGELALSVGHREVELSELGPAHTSGDTIAWVPHAGVLFSGDLLFTASTPIMWAGPLSNCLDVCDRILALEPRVIVPGHGPLIDAAGVRPVREYLAHVQGFAVESYHAGRSPAEAYQAIDLARYADWPHLSRTYQNIRLVYRELDPERFTADVRETLDLVYGDDHGSWRAIGDA
ncbi:MBL fold metallo-hydrolase [Amycolatopsis pithecellobii]|uniref:MBL fold metallo-hydrolase n=1 Tax=Amycolatopsis pithecellobii TaxID=664692 RepID=UPI001407B44E|nr:MBL fold metallo-hydrolase [Amycolatopsis pithecellobii]